MFQILTCIGEAHDLRLVLVAALICAVASLAAFAFHQRSLRAHDSLRASWMGLAGLVAGAGVWATHFVAMLAYQPSLKIGYAPAGTGASLVFCIIGMTFAFVISARRAGRARVLGAGVTAGVAMAGMHYLGIASIRAPADITLDTGYTLLSLVAAGAGSIAAFRAVHALKGRVGLAASAALFCLAVIGLHFTSMTAVHLLPDPSRLQPGELIGRNVLAMATTALATLILAAAGALFQMERSTQRSTLRGVREALDGAPQAMTFYDADARITGWNQASADLLGAYGVQVRIGLPRAKVFEILRREGWFGDGPEDTAVMAEVHAWRNRGSEFQLPNGRWMRHDAFQTADGGAATMLTDISAQRATTQAMAEARDAAEAASRAKSAFLANMSHEIRTPLNGILGIADVLAGAGLTDPQREMVGVIQSSGALLNALLTDLLDLARVEAGAAELRPEPADLADLTASVAALFAGRAAQKQLKLRTDINLGPETWVACDGLRLRQVMGNLLNNAVKFTDAGEVTVVARRAGDQVRFEVRDTGPGFDEAMKATLFGRFQQADDSSTRRHGGVGLGLAICQEYVRLMGGSLDCTSTPGAGSTFGFTLTLPPLAAAPPVAQDDDEMVPAGFRVLIVDDNAINRQVLGLILDAGGVDHAAVEDGALALDAMMDVGFDVVLMDIQMPVMDGLEATRRIRAWEAQAGRPRTAIYMVSANCLPEHVDAGMAAGADGHFNKPVSPAQVLGCLAPHAEAAAARIAA